MVQYQKKIVCFIDILGFRQMIEKQYLKEPEKIYSYLQKIRTSIFNWADQPIASDIDLEITQFSDSIVFSFNPFKHYFMTFNFFKQLAIDMVMDGIILRGGITYGEIFHNSEFLFGPAMIRAYDLEHDMAKFPRIVIDNEALSLTNDDGKKITDYAGQFVFKIDSTEYSSIDYIYDVGSYVDQSKYYQKLREIIIEGLQSIRPEVVEKYRWMKSEYNRAKQTFTSLKEI